MSSNNSSNRLNVPEARQGMEQFKMQAANEVGVNLKNGYNGDLTSREAGSIPLLMEPTTATEFCAQPTIAPTLWLEPTMPEPFSA